MSECKKKLFEINGFDSSYFQYIKFIELKFGGAYDKETVIQSSEQNS